MLDNLTEKFFVGRKRKKKVADPYYSPNCDEHGQWWCGFRKVTLIRHPEWTKDFYEYRQNRNNSVE
jgi:hypothetical protein